MVRYKTFEDDGTIVDRELTAEEVADWLEAENWDKDPDDPIAWCLHVCNVCFHKPADHDTTRRPLALPRRACDCPALARRETFGLICTAADRHGSREHDPTMRRRRLDPLDPWLASIQRVVAPLVIDDPAVLCGDRLGAVAVFTGPGAVGLLLLLEILPEITIATEAAERTITDRPYVCAVFRAIPPTTVTVWDPATGRAARVTAEEHRVAQVDWRRMLP